MSVTMATREGLFQGPQENMCGAVLCYCGTQECRRWEHSIKMDLGEIDVEVMSWLRI